MDPSESVNYRDLHRRPNDRSDEFFHQRPLSPHDNSFGRVDGQRHPVSLPSYHAREDQFQAKESSVWPRNDRNDYGKRNSRDYSPKYGRRSPNRYSPREHKSPYRRRHSPSPRKPTHYSAEGHRHRDQQYDRKAGYRTHSRSRSRSGSYSKRHYRRSRSPQRQSRHRDRSSSYDSRKRYHKSSSSSTSGPSVGRSRSSSQDRKPKDDFFKSIYPQDESREENNVNIHQSYNTEKQLPTPASDQYQNDNDMNFSNSAHVKPLNQGYVKSLAKKGFGVTEELDDDDRFLYGDDVSTTNMKKTDDPVIRKLAVEVVPPKSQTPPSSTASKVTPGGFDSNALKNVLKAIGFDFEMSAQQSKNEEVVQSVKVQQKAIPDEPKASQISAPQPVPAAVPAIQPSINAPPQPVQYYQPYNPYTSAEYISQQPFAHIQAVNSGFPISIQNPANPPGNFLIYHSLNAQSGSQQPPVQQIYTPQEPRSSLNIIQPQVSVAFKEALVPARVVLPSKENASTPSIAKDGRQARKERLKYLENELDKLKKQQNELMRKKRREKDGHKDPLIKKNTLLQAGVEEQIREIRKAGIEDESDEGKEAHEISSDRNTVYFDPGNHLCKLCNIVLTDLKEFLAHLHSKMHRKAVDPYDRPWMELEEKSVPKSEENSSSQSLKGSQFLIPITGYFCVLCKTFSGDPMCAEDHCRSHEHNASYKDYSQNNENYEDEFKKLESCSSSFNGQQEIQEPVQDEDQQEKVTKKKTKKHKHKKELIKEEPKGKIEKRKIEHLRKSYIEEETVKQLPKRYRDSPELKLTPNPDSRDRRRNCWSPGYDEYESRKKEHSHGKFSSDEEVMSRSREGRFGTYKRSKRDQHHRTHEKRSDGRRSQSREQENKWVEKKIDYHGTEEMLPKQPAKASSKLPTPGFGKFSWASSSTGESKSVFDQVPVDTEVKREKATDDSAGKEKFAIKMTGKSQTFAPRSTSSQKKEEKVFQKKKADLLKRVESLKRENALRAQLSAITLPAGRYSRPPVKPNTTAVLLGSRNLQKPGVSNPKEKSPTTRSNKEQPAKPVLNHPLLGNSNDEEVIITKEIEVDVSPSHEDGKEPPPPGEGEDMIGEDGAASDASGISMEIASDEE